MMFNNPEKVFYVARRVMAAIAVASTVIAGIDLRYGQRVGAVFELAVAAGICGFIVLVTLQWKTFESKQAVRDKKLEIMEQHRRQTHAHAGMAEEMEKRAKAGEIQVTMSEGPEDDDLPRH
jgi:hypothetical protein